MIFLVLDYQPCELVLSSKLQSSEQKKKKDLQPKVSCEQLLWTWGQMLTEKNMHRDRKKED